MSFAAVFDAGSVVCMSSLECGITQSYVGLLSITVRFADRCLVYDARRQTGPIQGTLIAFPTITLSDFSRLLWFLKFTNYFFVVSNNNLLHVCSTPITYFNCVPINNFMKGVARRNCFVNELQEFSSNICCHITRIWWVNWEGGQKTAEENYFPRGYNPL